MSTASSNPGSTDRDAANDTGADDGKTPSTDIQPEDAGTPASGAAGERKTRRGTAAERAMKQTSKTGNETGTKR